MAKNSEENNSPVTVDVPAPVQTVAPAPALTIERQGDYAEPVTRRLPQVRGGICEFCGTVDPNLPSEKQYLLCPHYRGIGEIRCSYCPATANPTDIVLKSVMNVAGSPTNPNQLVVWCNSYDCSRKHSARFRHS